MSAATSCGDGQGSWRLFSLQDIYRLFFALQLVRDGFTAKFVSSVLQEIYDSELLETDEDGDTTAPDIGVFRSNKGPRVRFVSGEKEEPYYVLRLQELINEIQKRMVEEKGNKA